MHYKVLCLISLHHTLLQYHNTNSPNVQKEETWFHETSLSAPPVARHSPEPFCQSSGKKFLPQFLFQKIETGSSSECHFEASLITPTTLDWRVFTPKMINNSCDLKSTFLYSWQFCKSKLCIQRNGSLRLAPH